MKNALIRNQYDETLIVQEKPGHNPLLGAIGRFIGRVAAFKERARAFYFEVVLSPYQCPECRGRLYMTGTSECSCSCGNTLDPTSAFQKSSCCGARLVLKTFHYACAACHRTVSSRFLFDEQIFDKAYFREMMKESRMRAKQKREEIRRLLTHSRSGALPLVDEPCLESLAGLIQDLDDFVQDDASEMGQFAFETVSSFRMGDYRSHILSILGWDSVLFTDITPFIEDDRRDRVGRFITLVFMENDGEIELTQHGSDLLIQRVYHEANA